MLAFFGLNLSPNPNFLYSEEEELLSYTDVWFDKLLTGLGKYESAEKQIDTIF